MSKNLVIVESPAKAKTIKKFLGKDYIIESCYGHISDLPTKKLGIDIENNFEPTYEIPKEKIEVIKKLKKISKTVNMVWLASDEDREGEAISWHLKRNLGIKDNSRIKRIVFHEITKNAIINAINNPRDINYNLVNAQQARRLLDRLVGFELSPILWKKVKRGLSAGRVQSIAVRLIVDRYKDIKNFKSESYYKVSAIFRTSKGELIKAEMANNLKDEKQVKELFDKLSKFNFEVLDVSSKLANKQPSPPFTTSSLQQQASIKLNLPISFTMSIAQKLYENGLITYMRTDSLFISEEAKADAKKTILKDFSADYWKGRNYKTKSKNAQESHEAIRPTSFANINPNLSETDKKVYDLIRNRALASQMADAQFERTVVKIGDPQYKDVFIAKGEVIKFEGFMKLDKSSLLSTNMLPSVIKGDNLVYDEILARQRFTSPPPKYSEASLVNKLEELGIGRPSTYVPTILTIQKRKYVEKENFDGHERKYDKYILNKGKVTLEKNSEIVGKDKGKFFPTDIGILVNEFLVSNFENVLDYNFTAKVEEDFDAISIGNINWKESLANIYYKFHNEVDKVSKDADYIETSRYLGIDPNSNNKVIVRMGRYGPIAQIGEGKKESKDDKYPKYTSLLKTQRIDNITLEEALDLFKFPINLGEYKGSEVMVSVGKWGPYIRHNNKFISIKTKNFESLKLEDAIELIKDKEKMDKEKYIKRFEDEKPFIYILKGRWGPYIKCDNKNYKIPKDKDAKNLSYKECFNIINDKNK